MAKNGSILPHKSAELFLTDGGLETTLIFLDGFELPYFAAFDLLKDQKGYKGLQNYYRQYLQIAKDAKTGFVLESPTWRANPDWIEKIGYNRSAITQINEKAIQMMVSLKDEFAKEVEPVVISGCVGPRGDGYKPENLMSAEEAQKYHSEQIGVFSHTPVDMISAITMNYAAEALGICLAANAVKLPVVISFTVETDGKLPTGMSLEEAIRIVDESVEEPPLYFMINCAHPRHFIKELLVGKDEQWTKRIKGIRANASCKSHAELDESTALDRGNPHDLGLENRRLKEAFWHLNVFGGCCGTDEEHVKEIANQVKTITAIS